MKIKLINTLCAVAVLMAVSACNDMLDLKPISDLTTENAYVSADDAEAALTGAYDSFSQGYYIWDNIIFNDVISDNYYAGGDNTEIFSVEDISISPTNSRLFDNWSQLYNAILKANTVLEKVPGITDTKLDNGNRRAQILGEASFLRAFHYYQLVKMWGGVPLITKPSASTEASETQLPRSSVAEVYAQIITDLTFAADNLPDAYETDDLTKARATKGAANAMLAKVYAQKPDRDYAKVIEYADAVINSPATYKLMPKFSDLFDGAHYNNAESIMEVQFVGGTEGNWGPSLLLPPSLTNVTWRKFITPSHDLVEAFDAEGDAQRKTASILFENAPWADEYWSPTVNGSVPFAYKWKSNASGQSTNRQYIVRLADIVLLKAEALTATDQLEDAKKMLNKIRNRAGLSDTPAATKDELWLAVLNERRLEFVQEAQRWDDLRRFDMAVPVMNNLNEYNLITEKTKEYNMTKEKELLPIPQNERNRNPKLDQNPGYN